MDRTYRRFEEQLKSNKAEYEKLKEEGQEAEALGNLEKEIALNEKRISEILARQTAGVMEMVYGDILWGLFNSTEFAFNH